MIRTDYFITMRYISTRRYRNPLVKLLRRLHLLCSYFCYIFVQAPMSIRYRSFTPSAVKVARHSLEVERLDDLQEEDYTDYTEEYYNNMKQFNYNIIDNVLRPIYGSVSPSFGSIALIMLGCYAFCYKAFIYLMFYPLFRLVFGTLYPAYASYKAVKSQNIKQYVKWMMYWIVFALFTCVETITDVFLSWFPFYYEIKIILVIWLLSPATKGSSFLYRKFVHPMLSSREQEIDEYISKAKEQSYKQVLDLGSKGVNALMQTALKGGGGLVNHIKKSYSLSDLSDRHTREEGMDETDVMITDSRLMRKRQSPRRTPSTSMYFSEIDVRTDAISSIQSVEDLSSGYSSGEALANQSLKLQAREGLVRSGSVSSNKTRPTRVTRSTGVPKKAATTEDDEEFFDNEDDNISFVNDKIENINNLNKNNEDIINEIQEENVTPEKITVENVKEESMNNLNKHDEVEKEKSNSSSDDEFVDTEEFLTEGEDIKITGNLHNTTIETTTDTVTNHISESETNVHKVDNSEGVELNNQCKKSIENLLTIEDIQCKKSYENLSTIHQDDRGGKYHKRTAPKPPAENPPTITATLILKPGIIKPLDSNTEVFCNSPKLKRKSISKSPSPSPKMGKKKLESPLNKLMMLPKKMGFFKHDDLNKRSSWFGGSSSLLNLSKSEYSKSTISLPEGSKEDKRITQQPPERQQ